MSGSRLSGGRGPLGSWRSVSRTFAPDAVLLVAFTIAILAGIGVLDRATLFILAGLLSLAGYLYWLRDG